MPSTIADLNELTAPAANDYMLVRDVSDLVDRDKKMQLGKVPFKNGTPTAGRVASWTDANTVQDAGFAASDVARLSATQTFTGGQLLSAGMNWQNSQPWFNSGSNSYYVPGVAVTAANTAIASLSTPALATSDYGGIVFIWARNGTGTTANTAEYVYLLAKNSVSPTIVAVEMAKGGLTSGGSAAQPSFTFTVDGTNNKLLASPVGSTSGTFYFGITCIGHIFVAA